MGRKRLWILIFGVALALSIGGDFLLRMIEGPGKFWWSHIPGFFALLGFIGCVAIIVIAKFLGHHWLQKKEDYYKKDDHSK